MMTMYLNKDEIDSLIGQAGFKVLKGSKGQLLVLDEASINNFAYLVQEDLREKMKWDGIHACNPDCQKPVCVAVREAVAAEREACAEACERAVGSASMYQDIDFANAAYRVKNYCQELIRARGK